jgi:heme/copper-type cytochrome/quinol oxidase subunit 2
MEPVMRFLLPVAAIAALACSGPAAAAEMPEFALVIKDHVYQPSELKVPADTKFKLRVTNEDTTPEEFESTDFNRETVVLANRSIVVYVGPLHAGTYGFFGDFHRSTAQGRLIVE